MKISIFDVAMTAFFLAGVALIVSVSFRIHGNSDNDVMRACKETGMYLKDGYAISCKVLENK